MYRLIRRFALIPHDRIRWLLILAIGLAATFLAFQARDSQASYASYDKMLAKRVWGPTPDARIVIVDIDEASLERMRKDFGRWPWPRETLAGALSWLESQNAAAVVFDILFSDPDPLNAASDEVFADAVAQSRRSYFPILRLNPANDSLSQVRTDQLAGFAQRVSGDQVPTLAVVPPVFEAVVSSTRMGYHNIFPSPDGINRHYDLWLDKDGWRLWSLPARLAQDMGWPLPPQSRQLIRYNLSPDAYRTIPFHEVWRLSQSREGLQKDPRFDGAIVLIGSTASSLFDVKATPISPIHPGVHLLANAIDNLQQGRFLRELPWGLYLAMTWVALALMGWASARMREATLNLCVLLIPGLLMAVSYASLHLGPWFVDLSGPASQALSFFSLLSVYQRVRTAHFSDFQQAGALGCRAVAAAPVYQGCLVLDYSRGQVDVQRLIDAAAQSGAVCGVVQTLLAGKDADVQASPAVVQLTAPTWQALQDSAQAIAERETDHARHSHLAATRSVAAGEGSDFYRPEQIWQAIGEAVARWSPGSAPLNP